MPEKEIVITSSPYAIGLNPYPLATLPGSNLIANQSTYFIVSPEFPGHASQHAKFSDDSFVVVWRGNQPSSGSQTGKVYFARLDAEGEVMFSDTVNNPSTAYGKYVYPRVTTLQDDKFVVVWTQMKISDTENINEMNVFAKIYQNNGTIAVPTFQVSSSGQLATDTPDIALLPNGHYVITWYTQPHSSGSINAVFSKVFDDTGAGVTSELAIRNVQVSVIRPQPFVLALTNSDYVVYWQEHSNHADNPYRYFCYINKVSGSTVETSFSLAYPYLLSSHSVNSDSPGNGAFRLIPLSTQQAIAVWASSSYELNVHNIYAQSVFLNGTLVQDSPTRVNQLPLVQFPQVELTLTAPGRLLIAWSTQTGNAFNAYVYARLFSTDLNPLSGVFQVSDAVPSETVTTQTVSVSYQNTLQRLFLTWSYTSRAFGVYPAYALTKATAQPLEGRTMSVPPKLTMNRIDSTQGVIQSVGPTYLNATDIDTLADEVIFHIDGLQHGTFYLDSQPVEQFSLAALNQHKISFLAADEYRIPPRYEVSVCDPYSCTEPSSAEVNYTLVNHPPVVRGEIPDLYKEIGAQFEFVVNSANVFFDADSDPLTFTAENSDGSSLPKWLRFNEKSLVFTGKTPDDGGQYNFHVKASDASATPAIAPFSVHVANPDTTEQIIRNATISAVVSGAVGLIFFGARYKLQKRANKKLAETMSAQNAEGPSDRMVSRSNQNNDETFEESVVKPIAAAVYESVNCHDAFSMLTTHHFKLFFSSIKTVMLLARQSGIPCENLASDDFHLLQAAVIKAVRRAGVQRSYFNPMYFFKAEVTPQMISDQANDIVKNIKMELNARRESSQSDDGGLHVALLSGFSSSSTDLS